MKNLLIIIFSLFSMSATAFNIELSNGKSVRDYDIKKECRFSGSLKKNDDRILQVDISNRDSLLIEDISDFELVEFFDIDKDGYCELMVGTGRGDVNEVYALFINKNKGERFVRSQFPTVYNPEVKEGKLILNYRDGAKTILEQICYSKSSSDFYLCRQEVTLDGRFNKVNYLDEQGNNLKTEVLTEDGKPAFATVTSEKSNFVELSDNFASKQKKSYLIKGDKVLISDYAAYEGSAWFKVTYKGAKSDMVGWMSERNFQ